MEMEIWNNKKLFKGTGIIIEEDIIPTHLLMVQKASEQFEFRIVWKINAVILAITSNGNKHYDKFSFSFVFFLTVLCSQSVL